MRTIKAIQFDVNLKRRNVRHSSTMRNMGVRNLDVDRLREARAELFEAVVHMHCGGQS